MTIVKVFWTTRDPYNGIANWQHWLDITAGCQNKDWGWYVSDVVCGETDERTVITIWFMDDEVGFLFKLSNDCEYYFGENSVDLDYEQKYNTRI